MIVDNQMPFSEELKQYRGKEELTQREMGQLLGISQRMYAYYESGEFDQSPVKICELFGITSHQLFNERLTVESLKPTGRTKSVLEVELEAAKREISLLKGVIKDKEKIIALLEGE